MTLNQWLKAKNVCPVTGAEPLSFYTGKPGVGDFQVSNEYGKPVEDWAVEVFDDGIAILWCLD